MAPRPTWKGALKLSLVSIPIRVFPATSQAADVSFRQLHRKCHTPIQLRRWCPHCDEEVAPGDVVKGFKTAKGYVMVEDEEITSLRPESTRTIDISHVVDAATVDPIYIERTYYLAPDSKAAGNSFAVFRLALQDKAGVGRLALHGREYLVAVLPRGEALLMYTLRTKGEVRDLTSVDGLEFADVRIKPDELKLARQVLQSFETETDLSAFTDRYEEALRSMLESKATVDDVASSEPPRKQGQVVNLMEALRQSLARADRNKARAPRRGRGRMARVIAHPTGRKSKAG